MQLESEDGVLQTSDLSESSCPQTVAVTLLVPAVIVMWLYDCSSSWEYFSFVVACGLIAADSTSLIFPGGLNWLEMETAGFIDQLWNQETKFTSVCSVCKLPFNIKLEILAVTG